MFSMLGYCQIGTLMTPKIGPGGELGLVGACWLGGAGASGVLALGVLSCAVLCWVCGCVWCLLPLRLLLRCRVLCLPFLCLCLFVVSGRACCAVLAAPSPASWFVSRVSSLFWMVCGAPSVTSKVSVTGYAFRYLPKHCAPHLHLASSQHFFHRKFPVCAFSHWSATVNVPVKVMTADETGSSSQHAGSHVVSHPSLRHTSGSCRTEGQHV